jgi:hypothetical protein
LVARSRRHDVPLRLAKPSICSRRPRTRAANVFRLNRRGYLFATSAKPDELARSRRQRITFQRSVWATFASIARAATYAAAPAEGFADQPIGADLLIGDAARAAFPYLAPAWPARSTCGRAGFMSGVNLGAWVSRSVGRRMARHTCADRVASVRTNGGRVSEIGLASGRRIATDRLVIAPAQPSPTSPPYSA